MNERTRAAVLRIPERVADVWIVARLRADPEMRIREKKIRNMKPVLGLKPCRMQRWMLRRVEGV